MWNRVICLIANLFLILFSFRRSHLFIKALYTVEFVQKQLLLDIIKKNNRTEFGREHQFSSISTIAEFKSKVSIATYDSYHSYIKLISHGKTNVLTKEPVILLEPSSGSIAPSKYIPYTKGLKKEFQNGLSPWLCDLLTKRRKLLSGKVYWSISPITPRKIKEAINVGFDNDDEYFGLYERTMLNVLFAVPPEVSKITNITAFRYITLLFLLKTKELCFISIWNPTFLTLLLNPIMQWSASLLKDIKNGTITSPVPIDLSVIKQLLKRFNKDEQRAEILETIFERWMKIETVSHNTSLYEEIWPNLSLISCWADGNAAYYIKRLKKLFPSVEIQPKGLIATEGLISFPLLGEDGAALSINSHFFEFIEVDNIAGDQGIDNYDTKCAHQLELGKLYSIIITTSGGLYRYKLQDLIKVVGFKWQCPLVRFVGKENKISDLFGEKLNEYHVSFVLSEIFKTYPLSLSFFMVAPERCLKTGTCFYTLFLKLEKDDDKVLLRQLAHEIEERLQENYHYKYCRELGQLSELQVFIIDPGNSVLETYIRVCGSFGQKLGNIKPSTLHVKMGWSREFDGFFLKI